MRNRKYIIGVVLALGMILTGCASSASDISSANATTTEAQETTTETTAENEAEDNEKSQLRVATFDTAAWNVAFNTARGAKYFDEEFADSDVDFSFITFKGGPEVNEAFLAGEVDMVVGMGDQPIITALAAGEVDNLVIAQSAEIPNMGLVVRSDSEYQSIEELKGKTLSVPIGMAFHKALLYMLQDAGINSDEVELANLANYTEILSALDKGDIDAGFVFSTGFPLSEENEDYRIIATAENHPMYTYILTSRDYYEKHPENVLRFLNQVKRGKQLFDEQPEEAYKLIAEVIGEEYDITAKTVSPNVSDLTVDEDAIQNLYDTSDFLVKQGVIPTGVDKDIINNHILDLSGE